MSPPLGAGPEGRIARRFASLKDAGRAALIPYLTCGDPDAETFARILSALPAAGADLIEVGMPFSDPMADGPAIQAAGLRALKAGMTLKGTLDLVRQFGLVKPSQQGLRRLEDQIKPFLNWCLAAARGGDPDKVTRRAFDAQERVLNSMVRNMKRDEFYNELVGRLGTAQASVLTDRHYPPERTGLA